MEEDTDGREDVDQVTGEKRKPRVKSYERKERKIIERGEERGEKILRLHTGRKKKTAETKKEIKSREKTSDTGNVRGREQKRL